MRRLLVLHSNDIHGRVEGLARIATEVERERERAGDAAVLYVDAGDVEDTTSRLSNLTKGIALHRLLRVAGCGAVAVGNGTVIRYGVEPLAEQAAAGGYPLLAANLWRDGSLVPGVCASAVVDADGLRVGLIGLTPANWRELYEQVFGVELPPELPLVQAELAALEKQNADVVILLSHLGHDRDRELAQELADELPLIVGSHSHTLLRSGERIGGVTIVQAGSHAEYLGRVELELEGGIARVADASVVAVTEETPLHPGVLAEIERIDAELASWLGEVVGDLAEPLELADDRECSAAAFMADVVRERMSAEVALVTAATAFDASLPAGPLTRGALYEACSSPGVSAATEMTGAQLLDVVRRGLDPELAAEVPQSFRGRARGLMHLSGAEVRGGKLLVGADEVDPECRYRVAGTDWELWDYGGYAPAEWGLDIEFDGTTIMREAVEEHLLRHPGVTAPRARIGGRLDPA